MSLIVIRLRGRAKKMHTFGDPLLDAALDCYISREVSSVSAKKIHPCLGLLTFPCWIRVGLTFVTQVEMESSLNWRGTRYTHSSDRLGVVIT